jgi:SAM-dependent methyltransferase
LVVQLLSWSGFMAAQAQVQVRYEFKAGPYSSHTLLLAQFPERGEGRRVLDIGCAAGYLSEILVQRGYSVACIDWPGTPHPATVEFSGADLDYGLGPVKGRFEYIICADVIEHLRDPLRLLKECRDRLAPGGTLHASLPNSAHWYFRWNVLMGRFPQHERGLFDSTHLHFYPWDGWVNLLGRAGFRVETVRASAVPVGLALPAWDGSWLVGAMERLSVECARIWKSLFSYQFIVRARAR